MTAARSAFEYAIVRVVPDIEREEFLNAGLILFCRPRAYLQARTHLDVAVLDALRPGSDIERISDQLRFVEEVAGGQMTAGPFGQMNQSERFHWLTAPRSTLVQPGPVHAGVTDDPATTFDQLYRRMVMR